MSFLNRLSKLFRLPTETEITDAMEAEPRKKTPPLESFKNSLRYSLCDAIAGRSRRQIDGGEFFCSAPLEELGDAKRPKLLDLIVDLEIDPPQVTRIWFELEFVRINRVEMTAIYKALCDLID